MGLGCGNPHRKAEISQGEVVLDLGSGTGLDCFIAGKKVGRRGRVIGVDMTPEMISKARKIAKENKIRNVEFRLGEIENLPVADCTADVCISNCVINMSDNKPRVYREIYRVLKPGGTLLICNESNGDTDKDKKWTEIIGGMTIYKDAELKTYLEQAGFHDVQIHKKKSWLCITARK